MIKNWVRIAIHDWNEATAINVQSFHKTEKLGILHKMDHSNAKGWIRQRLNEHDANVSINIPIIKLSSSSSLSRGIFYEDNEGNTVRPNKESRLFLSLK
jgi:hypothetical protein